MGKLWMQEGMEKQQYMEMLQQIEAEVECQMVVDIFFEMMGGGPVKEDAEVGEVMSLFGLADGIWSEVVLSEEEKSW